jgi:hypothetical protein
MNWKSELQENGVVVIPGFLTEDECADYMATIRTQIRQAAGGEAIESFISRVAPDGVIHGLDNLRVLWKIRTHPRVYDTFRELYTKEPLYLYVDRFNYRPAGHAPMIQQWHLDENPMMIESDYQAFLSLTASEEDDDCLGIMEKSHHHIAEYMNYFPIFPFYREQYDWFLERGSLPRRISYPAGSLVLWDSRCYHVPLNSLRPIPRERCVVYVRYFPAYRTSHERRAHIFDTYPEYQKRELDLGGDEYQMYMHPIDA